MAKKKASKLSSVVETADAPQKYVPSAAEKAREKKYQAEDDIRTMQRADEIKRDKARMSEMKKVAKEQVEALKKVC